MSVEQTVFISHSSRDQKVAVALCQYLEERALTCWMAPRDIMPGMEYAEAIIEGIDQSAIMIVIFNKNSNESKHVRNEIERAFHKRLTIIPFRTEEVVPTKSLEYFLSATHWLIADTGAPERYFVDAYTTCRRILGTAVVPAETKKPAVVQTSAPVSTGKSSAKKTIVISGIVAVIAIASFFLLNNNKDKTADAQLTAGKPDTIQQLKPQQHDSLMPVAKPKQEETITPPKTITKPDPEKIVAEEKQEDPKAAASATYPTIDGVRFSKGGNTDYIQFYTMAKGGKINFDGEIEIYHISGTANRQRNVITFTGKEASGTLVLHESGALTGKLLIKGIYPAGIDLERR